MAAFMGGARRPPRGRGSGLKQRRSIGGAPLRTPSHPGDAAGRRRQLTHNRRNLSLAIRLLAMNPLRLLKPLLPLVLALWLPLQAAAQSTMVRLHTTQGPIDFRLLDADAPRTVANFLAYVRGDDYANTMIHRSVPGFVIQGGGYRWPTTGSIVEVTDRAPVANEYSPNRSNVRGTVAMAKLGGNPDSATNEWFINLGDNSSNLDNQNGGFSVFARVTTPGMVVADRIAALRVVNAQGAFTNLPVSGFDSGVIQRTHVVLVTRVSELVQATDADRLFNYLEAAFPQFLPADGAVSGTLAGYTLRHYPGSGAYLGAKDGKLYFLLPSLSADVQLLGDIPALLPQVQEAGY